MTTPDVPLRLQMTFELPGTPEQVWHAIATGPGNTAWFLPTEVEEREGGALCFHMPPDGDSPGTVTGWEPPRRFAYEEPNWAENQVTPATPLATEMLVEARSGGTCVVRVVTSAFGTGAEWEQEMIAEMERGWRPFFDNLRLYLTNFAGQEASTFSAHVQVPGAGEDVHEALRRALGVTEAGQQVDAGRVERLGADDILLSVSDPAPGYVFAHLWKGDDTTTIRLAGYLFGDAAPAAAAAEQPRWEGLLQSLAIASS